MQCECAILSFVAYPGLPHYFINGAIFVGGGEVMSIKYVFDFPHNFCLKRFSFYEEVSDI